MFSAIFGLRIFTTPPSPVRECPEFQNHPLQICRTSFVDGTKRVNNLKTPHSGAPAMEFSMKSVMESHILLVTGLHSVEYHLAVKPIAILFIHISISIHITVPVPSDNYSILPLKM